MYNQVQSVTLQTAVLEQVKEFAQNNQTFSVHDVTRNLRVKTAQGDLEIPEVEVAGASFRFDIPHSKVKAVFDDLRNTGVFDPVLSLSRSFNGTYFEYTPSLNSQPNVTTTPSVSGVAPSTPVASPVVQTTGTAAPSSVSDSVVEDRVENYLTNCKGNNYRPTLKQIQSAIKRDRSTGWSCQQIKDYVVKDLGYAVVSNPDSLSQLAKWLLSKRHMPEQSDITITLPIEHFTALSAVIYAGLQHTNIKPEIRRELEAWWQAESGLIQDEIEE